MMTDGRADGQPLGEKPYDVERGDDQEVEFRHWTPEEHAPRMPFMAMRTEEDARSEREDRRYAALAASQLMQTPIYAKESFEALADRVLKYITKGTP